MKGTPISGLYAAGRALVAGCMLLLPVAVGVVSAAAAGPAEGYTIAVIPSAPPVTVHTRWAPFLERLHRDTGLDFRLKLYERMADFEREVGEGKADFIFSSPIQMVVAHQAGGYQPLVRGATLVSIGLFVRNDSSIKTIGDLSGRSISFVGNKNLCSVVIRHLLSEQKGNFTFGTEYSGSTSNVIKNVLLGRSAAGAVFIPELERESAENRGQIHAIVETPKMAPHPFSVQKRVPAADRESVQRAILAMNRTAEGLELLWSVRLNDAVAADYRRDYQHLEVIDVRRLTEWGK